MKVEITAVLLATLLLAAPTTVAPGAREVGGVSERELPVLPTDGFRTGPLQSSCEDEGYRQFDFWVGEWRVENPDGERTGTSRITRVYGACAIHEEYSSAGSDFRGGSYNIYDAVTESWHQTWVDSSGRLLQLDGGLEGESMVLRGTRTSREGERVTHRITWTPLDGGRVRQVWELSRDGGDSWELLFEGIYYPE